MRILPMGDGIASTACSDTVGRNWGQRASTARSDARISTLSACRLCLAKSTHRCVCGLPRAAPGFRYRCVCKHRGSRSVGCGRPRCWTADRCTSPRVDPAWRRASGSRRHAPDQRSLLRPRAQRDSFRRYHVLLCGRDVHGEFQTTACARRVKPVGTPRMRGC
jgi:hypothetical protein